MTTTHDHIHARPAPTGAAAHEHAWTIESRHRTSEGDVLYVRCHACGVRRIDLQATAHTPPSALTKPISAVGNNH